MVGVQLVHAPTRKRSILRYATFLQLWALLAVFQVELDHLAALRNLIRDFVALVQCLLGFVSKAFLVVDCQIGHARRVLLGAYLGRSRSGLGDTHGGGLARFEHDGGHTSRQAVLEVLTGLQAVARGLQERPLFW